jgi:hypothetical protein
MLKFSNENSFSSSSTRLGSKTPSRICCSMRNASSKLGAASKAASTCPQARRTRALPLPSEL